MSDSEETFLPEEARNLLRAAAQHPITNADPNARMKAIDRATDLIKRRWPKFFQEEPCDLSA